METTFALPRYVFPPCAEVHAAIISFCREALAAQTTPVLLAYSLGKSQELLQLVGGAGLSVQLHPQAYAMTRLYAELGVRLPAFVGFDPANHRGHVVIAPPQSDILSRIHPRRTALVSGWALDSGAIYRYGCDAAFPLSDHAGYDDLLAFVERVRPKVVYTLHGFAREFAATLRGKGIEAWAIGRGNQLELSL
jgi:Cft2 family RNA processing exonuclease